ncbi:MAG TPA: DUF2062 domain-containing protein [Flavobacteriales bacterium]|nr:DUF2062 domain-containing protein [Flavobacteriales bacterium]
MDSVFTYTDSVIAVNDGSTDKTAEVLASIDGLHVVDLGENCGKGIALRKGFEYALNKGFRYAITIDSDGQHLAEDLPAFLDKIEEEPDSLIVGARDMMQENIPGKSSFGHKFSNFWYWVETGINLPDTQSGFRLYPLQIIKGLKYLTSRYEFEIEVIVRAAWHGVNVTSVPVKVIYFEGEERVSHFRPAIDNLRFTALNTCLVTMAILYGRPKMIYDRLRKMSFKEFVQEHIINTDESNEVKAFSAGFGIFMGIIPIWGYQMALAIILAVYFKLNKAIVLVTAQISLPPLLPFILYASYLTGISILGSAAEGEHMSATNAWLEKHVIPGWLQEKFPEMVQNLLAYFFGSFVLAFAMAIATGLLTYALLILFRKKAKTLIR